MKSVKFLKELPKNEQKKFFESFDTVFFDMDGVIWRNYDPIPGAPDCLNNLKKLGKSVRYVTNNSTRSCENISENLKNCGVEADVSDVVNPLKSMIFLLRKSNVTDPMYVMAPKSTKKELEKHGYKILEETAHGDFDQPSDILAYHDSAKNQKIGAVLFDADFNIDYLKVQKAYWYLKYNPKCLFLVNLMDKTLPVGPRGPILGWHYFVQSVRELLKVDNVDRSDFISIGKPSKVVVDYIKETYNISQPDRVLFVGDSIETDLVTASKAGFQKLLVLSGTDKLESLDRWQYPDHYKPDYIAEHLGDFNDVLKNLYA
ncbi:unnamed protein product [Phyllotreta striolata]|uniref:4-nitrophenylphosphatase n=1 Tax=Phyllotreta striolata TaxID=444603 RepID=A0A9N9TUU7_PHYSR|nr:unnamed protein product [Phyllotreta striolata]